MTELGMLFLIGALLVTIVKRLLRSSSYKWITGPKVSWLGYQVLLHHADAADVHLSMVKKYGHVARLSGGVIGDDALYITDPRALQEVLVRGTDNFPESTEFSGMSAVMNSGDAVNATKGKEHRRQRRLINPVFTAANLAMLVPLFYNIARQAQRKLNNTLTTGAVTVAVDILDLLERTALELICQGGLGISLNSFNDNTREFRQFHHAVRNVVPAAGKLWPVLPYFESWRKIKPDWLRRILSKSVYYFPWAAVHEFKCAIDTMRPVYTDLFHSKKKQYIEGGALYEKHLPAGGRDLSTLLIRANVEADEEDRLPDETVIANMSSFMIAGQETTATGLSRLIWVMSKHPDLQIRLRKEIMEAQAAKGGVDMDYDELHALPLLDAVIRETMRCYPPVLFVWRDTMSDTIVPLRFPLRNPKTGVETRELLIKKGTRVYIGIGSSNLSTEIWGPDAAEFKPERWLGKSSEEVTAKGLKTCGVYSQTLTFIGGTRSCPGVRFAVLEMKLVMSILLPAFCFAPTDDQLVWRHGISMQPYVKGQENRGAQVPVKVSEVKN